MIRRAKPETSWTACHGRVIRTTRRAVLVEVSVHYHGKLPEQLIWVPRSQCQSQFYVPGDANPLVSEWFMEQKGLL